jgi:hypothetical protein
MKEFKDLWVGALLAGYFSCEEQLCPAAEEFLPPAWLGDAL